MSTFRFILKDFSVRRLWSAWTRGYLLSSVVRRCRRDRSVREVLQKFRQTFLRPRRTLLLSATAAFNNNSNNDESIPTCEKNITDEELELLLNELEAVEKLSKATLFCHNCGKRLVVDKKHPGIHYCSCTNGQLPEESEDGWVPYMEAEDVIIWRKEYKKGQGLYAYKVYGRYKDVRAQDFAAIQVDGAYRTVWDSAVASLSVVERHANGVKDQVVMHWEVLWPRLFANRDYVYIRRHKEFDSRSRTQEYMGGVFSGNELGFNPAPPIQEERPSVHSNAKRKAMENYAREGQATGEALDNKVYIILGRSCEHPHVPETKHAIRVSEYWSHMVIKTLYGAEKNGMEFVLTYYDEPAAGGLPSGVAAWATGRAAPAYLRRMKRAASLYRRWVDERPTTHETPDFTAFGPENVSNDDDQRNFQEQDMESSKEGPELNGDELTRDQSTQTDGGLISAPTPTPKVKFEVIEVKAEVAKYDKSVGTNEPNKNTPATLEGDADKTEEDRDSASGGWWRYLYPSYYFA